MFKLSIAIITFNEEAHIGRCIDSVSQVSDDILVVDSFSTDRTRQIAMKKGVRFIENDFEGHIQQKNFALKNAKYDYVLSLDADEALSEQAIQEVKRIKDEKVFFHIGFNRITNYCGNWIRHCGWYPDKKVRLVDRRYASWGGENPHDKLIPDETIPIKYIDADILHYAVPSIKSHAERANAFSEIAAKQAVLNGKKIFFLIHLIFNPMFTFFKKYFLQLGFLDGFHGFVISVISAYANFLKYSKIWQLKRENTSFKS